MKKENIDYLLFSVFIILTTLGIIMVFSSSMVYATYFYKDGLYFFKKQIISFAIGLIFFLLFLNIKLSFLEKISPFLLVISILLLIAVFIPGVGKEIKGVNRWLKFGPVYFQPSEMAKFSLIAFLSYSLSRRKEKMKNFFQGFLYHFLIFSPIFLLIMKEPDFGTAFVTLIIFLAMIFIGGVNISHIILLLLISTIGCFIFVKKENYRMKRIKAFLTSIDDTQDTDYQAWQSLIAIGSGRLKGMGLGKGKQKYLYLPQSHTDFIYAIIAEEFGFLGATIVVVIFLIFFLRGYLISARAPTLFTSYLSFGLTFYIVFQAFLNIGVVIGILPVTGIQLPFISYGGTSLIIAMSSTGVILNISKYKRREIYENNNLSRRNRRTSLSSY